MTLPAKDSRLDDRTEQRLSAYRSRPSKRDAGAWGGYAAATGAALAGASTAEAAIVHVVPPNPIRISVGTSDSSTTSIDLDADGSADFGFSLYRSTSSTTSFYGSSTTSRYYQEASAFGTGLNGARVFGNSTGRMRNFASGEVISASVPNDRSFGLLRRATQSTTTFYTSGGSSYFTTSLRSVGDFAAGVPGIVGGRFNSPRGVQFAWIRVSVLDADDFPIPGTLEILEWAYEDSGEAIRAGQTTEIPEPTGLALLAAGAAGVAALRRRAA